MKHRVAQRSLASVLIGLASLVAAPTALAGYVGPGAGFVLVASFLMLFVSGLLAFLSMLLWPLRMAVRLLRHARRPKPRIRRLVIIGFDGQDPRITDRLMAAGELPNFQALARQGSYRPLATTFPSVSPVAWSSFGTGVHPAKHGIFDFLDRDRRTYLPVLSSARIGKPKRTLRLGRFRIPLGRPVLRLLRKSKPFWSILGENGFWSTILRVPVTFPPDRFAGAQLSAMCVPDLLGTQGTFTLFTTRPRRDEFEEGGRRIPLRRNGRSWEATVPGPENPLLEEAPAMELPLRLELDGGSGSATLEIDGERRTLRPGELTEWIELTFRPAPGIKARGVCRVMLTEMDEQVSLYMTPIHLDPEKPAMPISHPSYYAVYLAKKIGKFATLGLAEDTWALNEGVIGEEAFLQMTYDIDGEREQMLFAALDRLNTGALVCVFDATDRIQHMFWRYTEEGHPARPNGETAYSDEIERLYRHNDALLGRIRDELEEDDVLLVLSDHGFGSFRRGVNLNAWLAENGYLHLSEGKDGSGEWLQDVDWSRTRAYAVGLTGLFLNLRGREGSGIVEPGEEAEALRSKLIAELTELEDPATGSVAIREAFDPRNLYAGPYLGDGPDLLIGYERGYRASWDGARGVVATAVFQDNVKAWSGDHCIDPRQVPGVLFSNRPIEAEEPSLVDLAPTALWLFGIEPPGYMDGKVLFREEAPGKPAGEAVREGTVVRPLEEKVPARA